MFSIKGYRNLYWVFFYIGYPSTLCMMYICYFIYLIRNGKPSHQMALLWMLPKLAPYFCPDIAVITAWRDVGALARTCWRWGGGYASGCQCAGQGGGTRGNSSCLLSVLPRPQVPSPVRTSKELPLATAPDGTLSPTKGYPNHGPPFPPPCCLHSQFPFDFCQTPFTSSNWRYFHSEKVNS